MKDIRLLCVVLVVGCVMGAATAPMLHEVINCKQINVINPTGKGSGTIRADEKGNASFIIAAEDGTMTGIMVGKGSLFTMNDSNQKSRIMIGIGSKGSAYLFILDSKGKKIWGASADENGVVTTYGH